MDLGDHKRRTLAGMKQERQNPRGRQTLFVVDLAPKKVMGEVSEGLLFDIGYADGTLTIRGPSSTWDHATAPFPSLDNYAV